MQNVQIVYCPSCGAPVKFLENREDTFCTSCGHQLFREDTHLEMKLKHEEVKMKYADRYDERRYKNKHEESRNKYNFLYISIGMVFFVILVLLIFMMGKWY